MASEEVASPASVGQWAIVTLLERREAQAGRIVASDAQGVTLRQIDTKRLSGGQMNLPAQTSDVFFPWANVFCIERLNNRETIHRIVNTSANPRAWLLPSEQEYGFDAMGWW